MKRVQTRNRWRVSLVTCVLGGIVFFVACSDGRPGRMLTEPSLEWKHIWVGTGADPHPTHPVCDLFANWTESCDEMPSLIAVSIAAVLNHQGFRDSDFNCSKMKTAMDTFMDTPGERSMGKSGSWGGLSAINESAGTAYGVWFNEDIFEWSLSERRRVIAHEAFHLAFFDGDHAKADDAANYCNGLSNDSPWGPV